MYVIKKLFIILLHQLTIFVSNVRYEQRKLIFNPVMHSVSKWSDTLWKLCCIGRQMFNVYLTILRCCALKAHSQVNFRQFLATESPLKMMKNAIYFTLKIFVLTCREFLPFTIKLLQKRFLEIPSFA